MFSSLIRPAMILVPFAAGIFFQRLTNMNWEILPGIDLTIWSIRVVLVIMLYLICLGIKPAELKLKQAHGKVLTTNFAMGLIPYGILHFSGNEELALAAFFIGITPTANAAPVVISFLNGRVGFVVTGFVITNLAIGVSMIFLIPLLTGNYSVIHIIKVFTQMLFLIGTPAFMALLTRRFYPQSRNWPARLKNFTFALWSFVLFIIACKTTAYFEQSDIQWLTTIEIMLISLLLCAGNFFIGAKLVPQRYARECSQLLGQKNTTLTIVLALTFGGPSGALVALGPTFYVLWHNSWNAVQIFLCERRRMSRTRCRVKTV